MQTNSFVNALIADTADTIDSGIPAGDDLFGWMIGSWELEIVTYAAQPAPPGSSGEVHVRRVLEGRAIQDLWIMPRREDRTAESNPRFNMYGTTLRVWDPKTSAWRVSWINPVSGARDELVGRREGNQIVQEGTHADGTPIRWTFREMTGDSFHWIGEALELGGASWKLEGEFYARRTRI